MMLIGSSFMKTQHDCNSTSILRAQGVNGFGGDGGAVVGGMRGGNIKQRLRFTKEKAECLPPRPSEVW